MSRDRRRRMIDRNHSSLSVRAQCRLVSLARSSYYYERRGESALNEELKRLLDVQYLETPFYGSRQMTRWLRRQGYSVGRKRVRRLMRQMGLEALYQKPQTSRRHPEHRVYPTAVPQTFTRKRERLVSQVGQLTSDLLGAVRRAFAFQKD